MSCYRAIAALVTGILLATAGESEAQDRDPHAGLYAIWYGKSADLFLNQPYIRGGQIVLQWASVEPRQGSYDFLMKRLPNDNTKGLDVVNIGPEEQRFGAWARSLPAGESMRLVLNPDFAASLANDDVTIRVVYLDEADRTLGISFLGHTAQQKLPGTQRWREFIVSADGDAFARDGKGAPIEIRADDAPIHLHMVEVQRVSNRGVVVEFGQYGNMKGCYNRLSRN